MDLMTLLRDMENDAQGLKAIALNPLAQFGRAPRSYLGATILPEKPVEENAYREDNIRYRTIIANSGTRYSPSQKRAGDLIGSMLVELGESDILREFTGRDYDALVRMLMRNDSMEGMAALTNWLDTSVNLGLVELLEKQRWDAIVSASVVRSGDNGYTETVSYSNPSGHRAAAGGTWSSDAYDPFADITAMADLLASKGYTVNRIITSRTVASILAGNDKVKARVGVAVVSASGQIQGAVGRASLDAINSALTRDGLPPMELYDLQYRTQSGSSFFLPRTVFVMLASTGRDEEYDAGDSVKLVTDTLGYTAVGRAVGQSEPGRYIRMEAKTDKPPRIIGEGWQTALPVITEPEAITVINTIS